MFSLEAEKISRHFSNISEIEEDKSNTAIKTEICQKLVRYHDLLSQGSFGVLQETGKLNELAHCDIKEMNNVMAVAEVAADCTKHMLATETKFMT